SSRRRHTRSKRDWSSDVCSSDLEFSFFKSKYTIEAADIEVNGNWWDMNFEIVQRGKMIGKVNKEWLSWGDSYKVQIADEEMEARSEERRVGKEYRTRRAPDQYKL